MLTTKTLENPIAAAAITGLGSPTAASGIAASLSANAQKRLRLIVEHVRRCVREAAASDAAAGDAEVDEAVQAVARLLRV